MKTKLSRQLLFTCEHGGNKIPKLYLSFFKKAGPALNSHRGWDPGAKLVAKDLAKLMKSPVYSADISRLLVDLNRSENHPTGFSEFSRNLDPYEKEKVLETYYRPYRSKVTSWLKKESAKNKRVFHFSIHSFTPVLHGKIRNCEIGILYDPKSALEKETARALRQQLREHLPELRVRMNYPYKGYMDGFTTQLRRELPPQTYSGIEVELNQQLVESLKSASRRLKFSKTLAHCLNEALKSLRT